MTKISENFTLEELTVGNAPKFITNDVVDNYTDFTIKALQPFRDFIKLPILVRVGYRNPDFNKRIGGDPRSEHMALNGSAAIDFDIQFSYGKKVIKEGEGLKDVLKKVAHLGLGVGNLEAEHDLFLWSWRINNSTIIELIKKADIPYNTLIDEVQGTQRWIHWGYNKTNNKYIIKTRRDGKNGESVYTTLKIGK